MPGGVVFALAPLLDRIAADDLAEQALLLVEQRQFPLLELLEELVPGNLHQRVVLRSRGVREHEEDDAHVAPLVGPLDGGGLATLSFRLFAAGFVIRGRLGDEVTSPWRARKSTSQKP